MGTSSKRALLVFVVAGLLQIVVAFLLSAIYFSVRTLTSSLELVETIPTYTNGILLLCAGILVIVLYRRKALVLHVTTFVLNVVCCSLCFGSAILIQSRSLSNFSRFEICQYEAKEAVCRCFVSVDDDNDAYKTPLKTGEFEFVFRKSPSCTAIEYNLRDYMTALCILDALAILLCLCVITVLVFLKCWREDPNDQDTTEMMSSPIEMEMTPQDGITLSSRQQSTETVSRDTVGRSRVRRAAAAAAAAESRLFPRITLPGMEERLINQSVDLPGTEQARLLRIQRHSSGGEDAQNVTNEQVHRRNSSCDDAQLHPPRVRHPLPRGVQRSMSDSSRSTVTGPTRQLQQLHPLQLHRLHPNAAVVRRHEHHLQQYRSRPPRRARSSCPTRPRPGNPYMPTRMAYLNLIDPCTTSLSSLGCFPYPSEPPPPYTDFELPPYAGMDPAPSYRSRSSPAPSI
ncbi:hypothetical protein CAPTEDRAFT_185254 [Capitella teleta]|uniref:Uncharacterized protein n=1 Tax=Capitella teleta TaxID=283909 RepID=R7T5J4_CAPTE|nr:hypothetical protein CAPTEDRAFT_185254 [Capitella teleta]|eukprot:ELT88311.1 hypothetical protein CAPTEDRAFT_185254 [Capitella teleta]